MPSLVESIFLQSAWASERLIEVCAPLSDEQLDATIEGVYGSIRATLVHALTAEQYYLSRISQHTPTDPIDDKFPGFESLKRAARSTGQALAGAAATLPPDATVQGGPTDGFTECDATVFLIQALNHSAEHRTQIMTMLTHLRAGPPDLDAQIDGWSWGAASGALRDTRSGA